MSSPQIRLTSRAQDEQASRDAYGRAIQGRASRDLYAAFILRCQELLAPQGLPRDAHHALLHVHQQLRGYARPRCASEVAIETLAHFGGGLFAVGNPGTLQTAAFVLRKETGDARRVKGTRACISAWCGNAMPRQNASPLKVLLPHSRPGKTHPQVFTLQARRLRCDPRKPWVYWVSDSIRDLFHNIPFLARQRRRKGLQTGENSRFLRFWWEVGLSQISADIDQLRC